MTRLTDDAEPLRDSRTKWVLLGSMPLIVTYYGMLIRALDAGALEADLDIQYSLSRFTAQGAIPWIDFEHGWNTASWYLGALLHEIAGGNATLWAFLWGRVTGFMLAGFAMLAIAWRLRLSPWWAGALVPAWMLVSHVPNNKYAVPLLWCCILLPVGRLRRPGYAQALRVGLTATVFWFHVELAILLGAGTAMYDAVGARALPVADRARRIAALGGGIAVGVLSQIAVYALLGLGPVELLQPLLFSQQDTPGITYGYSVFTPASFRTLVFPASLIVAFVPLVWRRLSAPTRLVATLHVAQALIAIRRPDDNHIAAAATLLAVLGILLIRDLARAHGVTWTAPSRWHAAGALVAGVAWVAAAIAVGFHVESRFAAVGLGLACLAAIGAAVAGDRVWFSTGALAGLAALLATGVIGWTTSQVRADEGGQNASVIAEAVRDDVARCVGPERRAWVVPGPLLLYEELDLSNPTPFYLFHHTFEGETPRVLDMVERGEIPAIVQVEGRRLGGWPQSMEGMVSGIEAAYDRCAELEVPETGNRLTVWTLR